jgi:hypothetical protein
MNPTKGVIMDAYSRRFAIKITEENRETIQFLYGVSQFDLRPELPMLDDRNIGSILRVHRQSIEIHCQSEDSFSREHPL